ncbi:MAG: ATP-binding cassette domain-containing protein [Candidatus Korobacteraceae bacterium]
MELPQRLKPHSSKPMNARLKACSTLRARFPLLVTRYPITLVTFSARVVAKSLTSLREHDLIRIGRAAGALVPERAWLQSLGRILCRCGARLHQTVQDVLLRADNLKKVFRSGNSDLVLFESLSLDVQTGEMLAIVGESGTGKSTLLHILGALDRASEGDVYFAQVRLGSLSEENAAEFRSRELGFVWQFHYLLPEFTAWENVAMPLLMRGMRRREAEQESLHWLQEVGLQDRASHRSGELSGGEQQRVALARALITRPKVLMADEPTGDLDNRTAETVFNLIARLHRDYRLTSLIVTHNLGFARHCDRVLRLERGRVVEVSPQSLSA